MKEKDRGVKSDSTSQHLWDQQHGKEENNKSSKNQKRSDKKIKNYRENVETEHNTEEKRSRLEGCLQFQERRTCLHKHRMSSETDNSPGKNKLAIAVAPQKVRNYCKQHVQHG